MEKNKTSQKNPIAVKRISFKYVDELQNKSPEQILIEIFSPIFGLENYLAAEIMGEALLYRFTYMLLKTYECNSMPTKLNELTNKILSSKFFILLYDSINKQLFNSYNIKLIELVVKLITQFLIVNPYTIKDISAMRDRLELLITNRVRNQDLKDLLEVLLRQERDAEDRIEKRKNQTFRNIDSELFEPSDDFTNLNVVPRFSDILVRDQEVYLRKNITNGSYKNVYHYLDVQFRLLREDFMKPLRDGVCEFRRIVQESKQKPTESKQLMQKIKRIDYLNTYFDVYLSKSIASDYGIVYEMQLNKNRLNSMNWETSRKLMFGSLVCFSSDYFLNECIIGVICERDSKSLQASGTFNVKFDFDALDQNFIPELNKSYVMLETSAFFESYKHVLKALQSFHREGEENFPFKENLVYCQNKNIPFPNYLKDSCIDFRPLVDEKKKFTINRLTLLNDYEFSDSVLYAEKCFLSNYSTWPTAEQMKLDQSQYEAIRLALTNKLALIQGPPGTGKTFIGVKIVQLLLHNKNSWWNKEREKHKPILMICYTNHALDQFLEYCIKECNLTSGIVRVGGRSKADFIEPFLLKTIKRDLKTRRQIDRHIHHRIIDEQNKVRNLRTKINTLSLRLSSVLNGECFLAFAELSSYIRDEQIDQLIKFGSSDFNSIESGKDFTLIEWLGLFGINQDDDIIKQFEDLDVDLDEGRIILGQNDDRDEDDETSPEELNMKSTEEKPNLADDSDSLNEERMLEDDFEAFENLKSKPLIHELKFDLQISGVIDLKTLNEMINSYKRMHKIDDIGWKLQNKNKTIEEDMDKLKQNLQNIFSHLGKKHSDEDLSLLENTNIWRLSYPERFFLYFHWINKYKIEKEAEIKILSNQYNEAATALQETRLQEDRSVMQDAFIIAMTTTGSSRYHSILKDIGPRIVIVEEAAEVFEAHIVSSLSKHCEHLILIGDHVQLRPNPAVYNLATKYHLDVSLFERLINNDTKRIMLNNQHRMRPEISVLMGHFYDQKIQDHPSVFNYPEIFGVKKNLFFIQHSEMEKQMSSNTTKVNIFEADYLSKLCAYLVKQNYDEAKISVLTMYLGQMMEIRRKLRELKLTSVKVNTVDNYQGEENDIVLLSLVRSNKEGKIGFLNIKNRVCVALSRAKHAFYTIGNFDFICENERNTVWKNVINTLKQKEMIGTGLPITCRSHPENDIEISRPEQFDQRPDGGCLLPCNYRLKCGHACSMKCHGNRDKEHKIFKCIKPCDKPVQKCGHLCKKVCSSLHECTECMVYVNKIIEDCGHVIKFRCDKEPKKINCNHQCDKVLSCGHLCTKLCREDCGKCLTKINVDFLCKHGKEITVLCSDQMWTYKEKCPKQCNEVLKCGHRCSSLCGECYSGLIHRECAQKCNRLLFCGHKCNFPCSKQCQPCQKLCENQCEHSKCPRKCSQPCSPCKEPCKNSCKHSKCTKLCNELCNREPCDEPCSKKLTCGHDCIGLCGEPCPKLCRICKRDKVTELFFGNEDDPDARFVHLKDCGHIIEASGLDYWIKSRYEDDEKNNTIQLPECPKCKTPIRRNKRYSNIIKKQLNLIEAIKLKQFGDSNQNELLVKELVNEIQEFRVKNLVNIFDDRFIKTLISQIKKQDDEISFNTIAAYKNTWIVYKNMKKIESIVKEKGLDKNEEEKEILKYEANKVFKLLCSGNEVAALKEGQKLDDILLEIERVGFMCEFFRLKNLTDMKTTVISEPVKVVIQLHQLENLLFNEVTKINEKNKTSIEYLIKNLAILLKTEMTKEEKIMIVRAIGLSQGHWYKCPNGHIYCIGDCGGAMQRAKCPECHADIGGENHQVVRGNLLATEMDGALNPAWPTAFNY